MYPVLYKSNETDFLHNGLGLLKDAIKAPAIEELNGRFELQIEYPNNGFLADVIDKNMIIRAKANDKQNDQLFRINAITKNMDNDSIIIDAQHITYDLAHNFVEKMEANKITKKQVMEKIGASTAYKHPFNLTSTNTTTVSSTSLYRTNPLQMVGGMEGSILQIWGGQIERDNFNLILHNRRGHDDGVLVKYRKNLTGLEARFDYSNLVTRIYPFKMIDETDDEPAKLITVEGKYIDSPHIDDYDKPYILPVDFSNEEDVKTSKDLYNVAKDWFKKTNRDKAKASLEVEFEHLWETEEYKDLAVLELVGMGDTITIEHEDLGIYAKATINYIEYDVLSQTNNVVKAGNARGSLTDSVNKVDDVVKKVDKVEQSANQAIISANGKNTVNYGPDEPRSAQKDDIWFKVVDGEYTKTYRYDGVQWQLVIDMDVNQAKELSQEARNRANEAVDNANLATQNAQDAIDKAQSSFDKAVESAGLADNALSTAQSSFDKASNAEDLANTSKQLSETTSELVDLLESTVDGHATEITKNANEISRKMSTVDADRKYATQSDLTQTSESLTSEISSVRADFDNLEIGGRNLISKVNSEIGSYHEGRSSGSTYNEVLYGSSNRVRSKSLIYTNGKFTIKIAEGFKFGYLKFDSNQRYIGKSNGYVSLRAGTIHDESPYILPIISYEDNRSVSLDVVTESKIKLEKGNKATDWSPAPEDMVTEVKFSSLEQTVDDITSQVAKKADDTELQTFKRQTAESFNQTVSQTEYDENNNAINNQFSSVTQTVEGMQKRVKNNEGDISSLTQTADNLTSTIGQVREDLDGLEISEVNLISNSKKKALSTNYLVAVYFMEEDFVKGETYTALIKGQINKGQKFGLWQNGAGSSRGRFEYDSNTGLHYLTFKSVEPYRDFERRINIYNYPSSGATNAKIEWIKLVRGNKTSMSWSPAPEDTQAQFSSINQTIGSIATRVQDAEGNVTSLTQIAGGLQTQVNDNKGNISKTTQLANVLQNRMSDAEGNINTLTIKAGNLDSTISKLDSDVQSQITQMSNNINARVKKGETITQINIDGKNSTVLIDGKYVHITGQTTIDDASIDGAKIKKASIGSAQIGTIDGAIANIVNVNARSIVGGILSSRNSNTTFNLDDGELSMERANFTLGSGADIEFLDPGNKIVYERYDSESGFNRSAGIGVSNALNRRFPVVYMGTVGTGKDGFGMVDERYFTGFISNTNKREAIDGIGNSVVGYTFHVREKAMSYSKGFTFELRGSRPTLRGMNADVYNYELGADYNRFYNTYTDRISGNGIWFNYHGSGSKLGYRMEMTVGQADGNPSFRPQYANEHYYNLGSSIHKWSYIHLRNQPIVNSDERLKEDIADNTLGLDFINDISTKTFRLKPIGNHTEKQPTQLGVVAQGLKVVLENHGVDTQDCDVLTQGADGMYSVQYGQLIAPTIKAVQELDLKVIDIKDDVEWLKIENQYLKQKIKLLEEKIA